MKYSLLIVSSLLLSSTPSAYADEADIHAQSALAFSPNKVELSMFPERMPQANEDIRVIAQLTYERQPITEDALQVVQEQKFHLLLVDPTLTDYQHVHPVATPTPGSYMFTFHPKLSGGYRGWADITPATSGKQQFVMADVDVTNATKIDRTESNTVVVDGYRFTLSFDAPPAIGYTYTGTLNITDKTGTSIGDIEPLMGSFAHIVAFHEDYTTVMRTRTLGDAPRSDGERTRAPLKFNFAPTKPGFVKFFAQVKIKGKEVYAPFGVTVASTAPTHQKGHP